ncbi:zinc finger protein 22-like [Uloborus diversus]|uniref:zinc finger protein 22-like n=1 Tax=Uloborus diversus TaxID=327109 RepID=UPI00240A2CC8|nr:zinc finger protein 22-like [Uloborus diversus]
MTSGPESALVPPSVAMPPPGFTSLAGPSGVLQPSTTTFMDVPSNITAAVPPPPPNATSKSSHVCDTCGKVFSQKKNLNQHLKIHMDVKPFSCDECGKGFTRMTNLTRHKMSHAPASVSGILKCKDCSMTFTRQDNLRRHERAAHGEAIHKCPLCDRAFQQKSNLMQHVRVSHAAPVKRKAKNEGPTPAKRARRTRETALGVFASEKLKPTKKIPKT